jgi:predicted secreted hydrolase
MPSRPALGSSGGPWSNRGLPMRRPSTCLAWMILAASCAPDAEPRQGLSVAEALGGGEASDLEGFERAFAVRDFEFPADHAPHPGFRSEWWYFTGNAFGEGGRRFGYHVTFFRTATRPDPEPSGGSDWRTNQLWMAHFAVVDVASGQSHAAERFARGALGLAGAVAEPFRAHVDAWSVRSAEPSAFGPLRLEAADGGFAVDLTLEPQKPVVLQGDRGLSQKGPEPGNASQYYSLTRLGVSGTIRFDGEDVPIASGTGWFDREWSTSALGAGQVGWDWFALHLEDGRDLMWYQLRREDGSTDSLSSGTLVAKDGSAQRLAANDVVLEPIGTWTSPRSGAAYPAGFRLRIPGQGLDLRVDAAVSDQELDLTFRYWEGAVDVSGSHPGHGFLEMTGYADLGAGR